MVGDEKADRLHHAKNKPELPTIDGETIKFPPYTFAEYPRAMYHATDTTSPRLANDARECRNLESRGWSKSPAGAEDVAQQAEEDRATIAALRAGEDQRMSAKARAEADHVEATTDDFVTEVPEGKKRGRPKKEDE